jgi:hypothetical protein
MASKPTVIKALRRFLLDFLDTHPALSPAQYRAIWAVAVCRTSALGGHLHACSDCDQQHYAYHSCNHKACPQCGRQATAQWVDQQQTKLIAAPYFMVTFTLPDELRPLFFGKQAKEAFDAFFAACSSALSEKLGVQKGLGAQRSGFTLVLHTWNQQLLFHPHIHAIVPGAGLTAKGDFVRVKKPDFLMPQQVLSKAFRSHFGQQLKQRQWSCDPSVWRKNWGVHIQPFGNGLNAVKYLGAYVARSVIGDSRILEISRTSVTFRYKDRAKGGAQTIKTLDGVEFTRRYFRHVLPPKLRAIRHYGFCHPAAKKTRLKVTLLSGKPVDFSEAPKPKSESPDQPPQVPQGYLCPCCKRPMEVVKRLEATHKRPDFTQLSRAPPQAVTGAPVLTP